MEQQPNQKDKFKEEPASHIEAREILGRDFFGPEEIKATFGIDVFATENFDVLEIPFSVKELEEAKALGQELVLYVSSTSGGKDLTVDRMKELLNNKTSTGWPFFVAEVDSVTSKETPRFGWRLSGKEPIKTSADKTYWEQTQEIVSYLKNKVFTDGIPSLYQDAIDEFETVKNSLVIPTEDDDYEMVGTEAEWEKISDILSKLKINQLCRESYSEVLYRLALHEKKTGKRLLDSTDKSKSIYYTWTNTRNPDGNFVSVGDFVRAGADTEERFAGISTDELGVCFSRGQ